jgi:hypothetical protein
MIAFGQQVGGIFGGNMDAQRAALAQSREQLRGAEPPGDAREGRGAR